ncbi:hypothetical protein HK097_006200 [Rhizophlyctis rosea]|uniref:Uncharacterized protein n=1 Tax=Rhizophlyctis rosea TaxID=64517 RepID=A0AAD5S0T5_9FUNG|nr:hypothetical protein HK097_006200 [Rhizophlyctis rosea]
MKVVAGVTLKEGDIIKRGPPSIKKTQPQIPQHILTSLHTYTHNPTTAPHPRSYATTGGGGDTILDQVLSKARPTLKPVPFPVGGGAGGGLNDAYARLPNIKDPDRTESKNAHAASQNTLTGVKRPVAT